MRALRMSLASSLAATESGGNSPYYNTTTSTWWQYSDTLNAFEDTGVGNLIPYSTLNPYFSSKFIKRIEKSPADQSISTYVNGIFDITLVNLYAGLNFWVNKDDLDVYYVINIKSAKYTTWETSAANHLTYGARKYNSDA